MSEATLQALLRKGQQYGASDLILKVGKPPAFRVNGELHFLKGEPLGPEQTRPLAELVVRRSRFRGKLDELTEIDTSYTCPGVGRYRCNVYRQRGTLAIALRAIPFVIPTVDSLLLPPAVSDLAERPRGLILVVGAAGHGKSTTLAAMLGQINEGRRAHIITIEDPIEYVHEDRMCCVSQREIGIDTPTFPTALRAALRQDPDVILVGEIRDEETMDIALKAAETGHLVLSTLHTPDVGRTVGRILALSERLDPAETRHRLADNLQGIVAQRLLPRADGKGRVVTAEILVATGTARETIRRPAGSPTLHEIMERGTHPYGMQTFRVALEERVHEGLLTTAVAREAMS